MHETVPGILLVEPAVADAGAEDPDAGGGHARRVRRHEFSPAASGVDGSALTCLEPKHQAGQGLDGARQALSPTWLDTSSVDEFVTHVIEKELAKFEGSDSEEDIKKKLKGLGYIS